MLPFRVNMNRTSAVCMDAPAMGYMVDVAMWNQGRFDAWNTMRDPGFGMSYWTREDLPYYYSLYDNFLVGDQYHQSTLTETNPNVRHFQVFHATMHSVFVTNHSKTRLSLTLSLPCPNPAAALVFGI